MPMYPQGIGNTPSGAIDMAIAGFGYLQVDGYPLNKPRAAKWRWLKRRYEMKVKEFGLRDIASDTTPPPHTAAMVAWAKQRIAEIGELRRMDMVGFNELDELRVLEAFVGEWETSNG
jgi:hypothetical protein